ncbi:uncharacterized protein LOC129612175 [Condylostylus longicornis]|uniref:uncharacterized protein LOC129612175 n=1 Tax=Condylostylus longicornis TaxID=2530218 RepID=UPI00244E0273|nr:uncharacterized protein LOC129612175 [Condylostylus longicornis]
MRRLVTAFRLKMRSTSLTSSHQDVSSVNSSSRHHHKHKKGPKQNLKKCIITCFIFCITFFIIIEITFNQKLLNVSEILQHNNGDTEQLNKLANKSKYYYVNTIGCKIPKLYEENLHLDDFSFNENFEQSISITSVQNGLLKLNTNRTYLDKEFGIKDIEKINCFYQYFNRKTDTNNIFTSNEKVPFKITQLNNNDDFDPNDDDNIGLILIGDANTDINNIENPANNLQIEENKFIKVSCNYDNKEFYENFHYSAKDDFQGIDSNGELSVFLIGISNASHFFLLNHLRNIAKFMRKSNSIEYYGYSKIGEKSYQYFYPLLCGLDENELHVACNSNTFNESYDRCPFIWKRFKTAGYTTIFAEDVATNKILNFTHKGFSNKPTDFYLRPLLVELEKLRETFKLLNYKENKIPNYKIIDLLRQLNNLYHFKKSFTFYWITSLYNKRPIVELIDNDIFQIFSYLSMSGILNNTILFFVSDHGAHINYHKSYLNILEERQPFLFTLFPNWFEHQYPKAFQNFRNNFNKLTTAFDLHETLYDLSDLRLITDDKLDIRSKEIKESDSFPRGISLFLPIPQTRTCELAGISYESCTCLEKKLNIAKNDLRIQRAARYMVQEINQKVRSNSQCRHLHLNSILDATIETPNKKLLKQSQSVSSSTSDEFVMDITLRIQTKPGLAEYESVVRVTPYTVSLTGVITRINYNSKESFCIEDSSLKIYCYCFR